MADKRQEFLLEGILDTLTMDCFVEHAVGTDVSVRESTHEKIVALIPGLQKIRRVTLPQMYFECCSIRPRTYGRVNPLFSHPEGSVVLIWTPGSYHRVYFMLMSQFYPHYQEFQVHTSGVIVFPVETTKAISRRIFDPPVTKGNFPPQFGVVGMILFILMPLVRQDMMTLIFLM